MAARKAADALAGGAEGYRVPRLQREIAACLGDAGLDGKPVIAGMVAGEHLAVDAADDMKVVRVADSVAQRDPRPAGTEAVRSLGARVIDVIGIGIVRAVQVAPAIEFRPRHVAVVGHGNRILAEFQPVRRHVIVDHETEHVIQRLVLADSLARRPMTAQISGSGSPPPSRDRR